MNGPPTMTAHPQEPQWGEVREGTGDPLTPSHIPGVAERRSTVLTGRLSSLNDGLPSLVVARCLSALALGMALPR